MAYLDSHGLQTLWTKIKATFGSKVEASTTATTVEVKLENASGTVLGSSASIGAATTTAAGVMSAADKTALNAATTKLAGIEAGAQVNVQADWNVTDTSSDAYIANKPSIPEGVELYDTTGQNTDGAMTQKATSDELAAKYVKPTGGIPSSDMTSAVQGSLSKADTAYQKASTGIPKTDLASAVQTTLGKADTAYQKPTGGIPASDLAETYIKPTDYASATNAGVIKVGANLSISGGVLSADAQPQEQANWTETDSTDPAYIKNKPTLATVATSGNYNDLSNKIEFEGTYSGSNKATTKSYVDGAIETAVTGNAKYQGAIASEADVTSKLKNAKVGYYWNVTASFTSTTFGVKLDAGNQIFCHTATTTTVVPGNFDILQVDIEAIPDTEINALS